MSADEEMSQEPVELGPRFAEAITYMLELHGADRRKTAEGEPPGPPYVGHLIGVAGAVIDAGGSEDEAIAALLHDAAEDVGGEETLTTIGERFGPAVADIVRGCSDTTTPEEKEPWEERKERYLAHLRDASPSVIRVSFADKLFNIRAILRDHALVGDELWGRFSKSRDKTAWYYRSLADIYAERVRAGDVELAELPVFEAAVVELEGH